MLRDVRWKNTEFFILSKNVCQKTIFFFVLLPPHSLQFYTLPDIRFREMGMDHRIIMNGGTEQAGGYWVNTNSMCHSGPCVDEGKLLAYRALKHYRLRFKCVLL
jgi:hypothetical protein